MYFTISTEGLIGKVLGYCLDCFGQCLPAIRKFCSYSASFKLKVIDSAKAHGKREAGRTFSVNEKSVRQWYGEEDALRKMKGTMHARIFVEKHVISWK